MKEAKIVSIEEYRRKHRKSHLRQTKVLIIDDNKALRDTLVEMLAKEGIRSVTAPDGLEALEILKTEEKKVILTLLNLKMPVMNGFETFEHIKVMDPQAKILIMSGYPRKRAEVLLKCGALYFLHKPFSCKQFVSAVRYFIFDCCEEEY